MSIPRRVPDASRRVLSNYMRVLRVYRRVLDGSRTSNTGVARRPNASVLDASTQDVISVSRRIQGASIILGGY